MHWGYIHTVRTYFLFKPLRRLTMSLSHIAESYLKELEQKQLTAVRARLQA